jgi:MFS family permease
VSEVQVERNALGLYDLRIVSQRSGSDSIRRLMLFFAVVYTVEGIGQVKAGIIWQPLTYFLKTQIGWNTVQIAASLSVLDVPWIIKPLYGVISDFLPLFGYRRRSYLLLSNVAAGGAFLAVAQVVTPSAIVVSLLLTSIAMAVSSTLCGALLVENGQRYKASSTFVNQQWLWFNAASAAASLLGGALIELFSPAGALHAAALLAAVAPIAVLVSLHLVNEMRAGMDGTELRARLNGFLNTFRSRTLWMIAAFLFLYYYNPGFGTPLYFHMTDRLRFSQGFIGALSAVGAVGWVTGGLLYRWLLADISVLRMLRISIVFGTVSTLSFLLMKDPLSAVVVYFLAGMATMIANVATLTLAANHAPERAEGFAFAALMSVINLSAPLSDTSGAFLYQHLFSAHLAPLIIVSAAFTAFALVLIPIFGIDRAEIAGVA